MRVGEGGVEGGTLRLRRLSCACRGWLAEGEGSPGLPPILGAGRNRAGTQGQRWQLWPRVVGRRRGSPFVCLLMLLVATSPSYRVGISFVSDRAICGRSGSTSPPPPHGASCGALQRAKGLNCRDDAQDPRLLPGEGAGFSLL